ncbi:MAG: hypothetical protein QXI45_01800, partial [Thermofilaceae archaeon]
VSVMKVKKGLTIIEYDRNEVRVRQLYTVLSDDDEIISSGEYREIIPRRGRRDEELEKDVENAKKKLDEMVKKRNV